jgi:hypothetical protein
MAGQVRIGGLWHDPANVEHVLHKYCRHIFVVTDDERFPYSFRGSGTVLKWGGRHFLFCCRHQVGDCTPGKIAMRRFSENKILSASRVFLPDVSAFPGDEDRVDIVAFEYDVQKYAAPNLSSEFFEIEEERLWPNNAHEGTMLLFGFPFERQRVDYEEPRIQAHCVEVKGTYDGAIATYLHRVRMDRKETFNADGMSGGPVFYLGRDRGSFFAGFAGMIVRGGAASDFIHFIPAEFLIQVVQGATP